MLHKVLFVAALVLQSFTAVAHPKIGASLTNAAVETLIVGAPIPNLDGGSFTITPQYGIIKTKLVDKPGVPYEIGLKPSHSGEVNGNSAGLGFTLPSKGDFSFFLYGTGAQQTGDFKIEYENAPTVSYMGYSAKGMVVAAAAQYRLVGDADSVFAMGVFAGPGYYSFQTELTYDQEGSGADPSKITFNPNGFGALTGFQLLFRLWKFRINPYALGFTGFGNNCHKIETTGTQIPADGFTCGGQNGYTEAPSGFGGLGLGLGFGFLRFNVFTYLPAQDLEPFEITSYSLSLGIPL